MAEFVRGIIRQEPQFVTTAGTKFETRRGAVEHQAQLDLYRLVASLKPTYGRGTVDVDTLIGNAEVFHAILADILRKETTT